MTGRELGRFGEETAANFLKSKGCAILEMNYQCRFGEVDIIFMSGGYIVFAEVKLRKNDGFAKAREFVTRAKRERITTTALLYLQENAADLQPRFDVIEIYAPQGENTEIFKINHIENAF
jgi:putative endonuclease